MTIVQMQYFAAVCENGSISKSAELLHISQPSISMAIKDLEKEFDVVLFIRENRQLKLSQEGMHVYECVKDILARIDALQVQMADIGKSKKQLCLGIPNLTGMFLFSSLLSDFHHMQPNITLKIEQCGSAAAFKRLEDGTYAAALTVEPESIPDNLDKARILSSEFEFCVAPSHRLAGRKSISLAEIENEPLVMNQNESYMTRQIKKRFYENGMVPNILLHAVQLEFIMGFVTSGKAGTFLAKELADGYPGIAAIPLKEKIPVNFAVVWSKERTKSRDAQILIDFILERSPIGSV